MKKINGNDLIALFEQFSPTAYALDGDNVGLQIGTLNKPVNKIMVALDVLEHVASEAVENGVDLIIAHHPLLYRPLHQIALDSSTGRTIEKLIKHDIAVYAAHTNLDIAKGGVNDLLAEALHLKDCEVLVPTTTIPYKKMVVFVPESDADNVRKALGDAGAGAIGNYSHCSFTSHGTGSFLPGDKSNPHIGERGKQEFVSEVKIESIYPAAIEKQVIEAVLRAHPYEEVAYDLYPLENEGESLGLGRIGMLPNEMTLREFVECVKSAFDVPSVRVVGELDRKVSKVAVLGGDGNKYVKHAIRKRADVYVTGDVSYHVAHDAMMEGLNIVDPGHHAEKIMKEGVRRVLREILREKGYDTEVISSNVSTEPFQFM